MVQWSGVKEPVSRAADQVDNGMAYCAAWEESTEREGNGEGWGGGGLYT